MLSFFPLCSSAELHTDGSKIKRPFPAFQFFRNDPVMDFKKLKGWKTDFILEAIGQRISLPEFSAAFPA